MEKDYFILNNGRIKRKNNTVYFETDEKEEAIPVKRINNIYLMGVVDLNTQFMNLVAGYEIPVHFFSYYGYYTGTFFPKDRTVSGKLLIQQIDKYRSFEARAYLARNFVKGSANNILNVLNYYKRKEYEVNEHIEKIKAWISGLDSKFYIHDIMAIEANIRKEYYSAWNKWLNDDFRMDKRTKKPPQDKINTLISFINSMLYTTVITQIYVTQLDPTISYLHEPGERRYSLALDIADIFKPIIVDRLIFYLVNKGMLDDKNFNEEENICYLNEKGKKIVLKAYDEKMKSTFNYWKMEKYISYKMLIRVECYKLIKHLLDIEKYEPFRMEW